MSGADRRRGESVERSDGPQRRLSVVLFSRLREKG
jgi:hypothetical protein